MADQQSNTPEYIAYRLMVLIGQAEKKLDANGAPALKSDVDRKWVLATYGACLSVVIGTPAAADDSGASPVTVTKP